MKLSKPQLDLFWRLWASACRCQGWTPDKGVPRDAVEERRRDLLSCYGFASLKDVDRTAGFDAIKAALMTLCDSLDGAVESDHPEIGEDRRIVWHMERKILPRIGPGWRGFVSEIMLDRGWGHFVGWDLLSAAQLRSLCVTLTNRARAMAKKAAASQTSSQ